MYTDLDIWNAIYALYELLTDEENSEKKYQTFFESHPVVFKILGFDTFQSYEKSSGKRLPFDNDRNFRPEPDFLCGNIESCTVTVFELKTPFVKPFIVNRTDGNRAKLNATAESYLSQATEYAKSIQGSSEARSVVKSDLSLRTISSYQIIIVYGLTDSNDMARVSDILQDRPSFRPTFLCYDLLLEKLVDSYLNARRTTENRTGWSIVYHLIVNKEQLFPRSFIADHGSPTKNRLSVFIENGHIVYQCIDNDEMVRILKSPVVYDQPIFLRFELATDDHGIYLSLNVNNEEQDLQVGRVKLNFNMQLIGFVLGTDISCKFFGRFYMLEAYYLAKTMSIEDKLGSYHYFKRKTLDISAGDRFDGKHYLVRDQTCTSSNPGHPDSDKMQFMKI